MKLSSALYVGEIEHRRLKPKSHEFRYKVLYYFLDLDEVPQVFNVPLFMSLNSPGLLSFWRKDYFGDPNKDLSQSVRDYVLQETGEKINGPIKLLTNISYFGFCFNPVSFYYCYDDSGEDLTYVVAEITNTPWGERHRHLLPFKKSSETFKFQKNFHVSPFMPMDIDYTWVFQAPKENLYVLMQNRLKGETNLYFDSTLKLRRMEISKFNIMRFFMTFPFVTLKTMTAIYYQAARLYLKKVPFFTHPKTGEIS